MNLNALYIARLAKELNKQLEGAQFLEAFSNEKNTLYLSFKKPNGNALDLCFRIEANSLFLFIPEQAFRSSRKRLDWFKGLWNSTLLSIKEHPGERSLHFEFKHGYIAILAYGRHANVLELSSRAIHPFRAIKQDDFPFWIEELKLRESAKWPNSESEFLQAAFMNTELIGEMKEAGSWQSFVNAYWEGPVYLNRVDETYSLAPRKLGETISEFPLLLDALTPASELYLAKYFFSRNKQRLEQQAKAEISRIQKRLKALSGQKEALRLQSNYRHLGDLILSNLPQIKEGDKETIVIDYLNQEPLRIVLHEKLSPQDNAQRYYRKAKNQHIQKDRLDTEIDQLESSLFEWLEKEERIAAADDMSGLRGMLKAAKKEPIETVRLPYHTFMIQGFTVLVGKQAKDNDELSLKIAKKDDLWLHARDISGSHVVIRKQGTKAFPEALIELAAGLALWFSKRRTETLAPVIYTEKKNIRKRKGDPAGAVVVDKENVIIVAPVSPDYIGKLS